MNKIIILSHAMEIGGAERALLGLLESIDPNVLSVDLFLLRHEGELMQDIPEYVNLLPQIPEYSVLGRPLKQTIAEGHILLSFARLVGKCKAKLYNQRHHFVHSDVEIEYSHKYTKWFMPQIQPDTEYDLAISFLTPHYFVAEKVRARKKIAWIHTDYSTINIDIESELAMWSKYDHIISISEEVTVAFVNIFPSLKERIVLIENILPASLIKRQADEYNVDNEMPKNNALNILTIGRFAYQKRMEEIPVICKYVIEGGVDVRWFLIGYGGDEQLIRQRISEYHMEQYIYILGKKENPYPYIKKCDLYIQPSRYEGKAMTVREAQMFAKPVIITAYPTSGSQLEHGVDGIIVPMDAKQCAESIVELLSDTNICRQLSSECSARDYSNAGEIKKIYNLLME